MCEASRIAAVTLTDGLLSDIELPVAITLSHSLIHLIYPFRFTWQISNYVSLVSGGSGECGSFMFKGSVYEGF